MIKKNQNFNLKDKIINSLMHKGCKESSEKIFKKSIKRTQKLTKKNCKVQLQTAIINLTPTFKLTKQSKKRGKKKQMNYTPIFLPNNLLRISFALKLLKNTALKNKSSKTYEYLSKEILASANSTKAVSVEQKNSLQKQVLSQKRYFYKFRW